MKRARSHVMEPFIICKACVATFEWRRSVQLGVIAGWSNASINESETIKERKRIFSLNKTREAERIARPASGVKVYEITVKNSELPGLTELGATNTTNSLTFTASSNSNLVANVNGTNGTMTATTSNTSTNTVKSVAPKKTAPPFDPMLEETEQILEDYIQLLAKNGVLMAHE